MICAAISGPSYLDASKQLSVAEQYSELAELRLDLFEEIDMNEIAALKNKSQIPLIFTFRSSANTESEEARLKTILQLASLHPAYIDLESTVPHEFIIHLQSLYSDVKLIISHHDFDETPIDFSEILTGMQKTKATFYKLAFYAKSALDALRLLVFTKEHGATNLITVSMGEEGTFSRILAPLFGSKISYASLTQQTAPGQIPATMLVKNYRAKKTHSETAIYALIGYPLANSISDLVHNALYDALDLDAIYVKIRLQVAELARAIPLMQTLGFKGLSVTMPLKEAILETVDALDETAKEIGAVNTVVFKNGKTYGYNTDCTGAIDALESMMPVHGKKLLLLGAGGVARAIAFEAVKRGAYVIVCNRDEEKAKQLASLFQCEAGGFEHIKAHDILINATPLALPIEREILHSSTTVMETTILPIETELLQEAKKRGCLTVSGYKMWIEQALGQYNYWMGSKVSRNDAYPILEDTFISLAAEI